MEDRTTCVYVACYWELLVQVRERVHTCMHLPGAGVLRAECTCRHGHLCSEQRASQSACLRSDPPVSMSACRPTRPPEGHLRAQPLPSACEQGRGRWGVCVGCSRLVEFSTQLKSYHSRFPWGLVWLSMSFRHISL